MKQEGTGAYAPWGLGAVLLGINGLILGLLTHPLLALVFGVVGMIFSMKQRKLQKSSWSTAGLILNTINLIIGIIGLVVLLFALKYLTSRPHLLAQLQGLQGSAA